MRVRASRPVIAVAAAAAILLAACGSPATPTPQPTPSTVPSAVAPTPAPTPLPTAAPTPTPTPAPTPTPTPTPTPAAATACLAANLAARITQWEGAMGHLIAHVELTNNGPACLLASKAQPQLVDGHGSVLINGAAAASSSAPVGTGEVRNALVQDGNYCGPAPVAPVSVAFVLPAGAGRVVATPLSATDSSGVPGCLGGAGSAGTIEMQPWGS